VIRRKKWSKKGKRKKVTGRRKKVGALRFSDKKRIVEFLPKSDGDNFYLVLKSFYEELKHEWAGEHRKIEDFETKIVIILDNASLHNKKEIVEKIEAEMPNIVWEFLPEYSPDYNLIELVWHSAKEFISNRLFSSIFELEALLHKLLNEGELIINWGQGLKNMAALVPITTTYFI